MDHPESLDALFQDAVSAIDAGDVVTLERLLAAHPRLVRDRLDSPGAWLRDKVGGALDGFFRQPYLLWFVAEDPVRNGKLPPNILNAYSTDIYEHATALHHAVWSGSLDAVKVLVEAGAELATRDKAHQSTPLGWAEYGARGSDERATR